MTADREALLAAILDAPAEDAPRLVFADWLDEHGEGERAAHIRWAVARPENSAVCLCRQERLAGGGACPYCRMMGEEIAGIPRRADGDTHYVMNRGFVSEVRCSAAGWLQHGPAVVREHPVEWVTLSDRRPWWYNETCVGWFEGDGTHCLPPAFFAHLNPCDTAGSPPDEAWQALYRVDELYDGTLIEDQIHATDAAVWDASRACVAWARAESARRGAAVPG